MVAEQTEDGKNADELVARTVRVPRWLDREVAEVVADDPLRELDFTKFARRAIYNEVRRLRGEKVA